MFRTAVRRAAAAAESSAATASERKEAQSVLQKGAKRDPELYILLGIMSGAFGLAGFYFGRKPTSATSEASVSLAKGSMPWQVEDGQADGDFKYQYHPGGDVKNAPKNAPSALHSVIVPNVNLPKSLHEQFNKWGKDGY